MYKVSGARFGCDPVLKSSNFLSLALSSDSSGVGGVIKFNQPLSSPTYPQSSTNISLSSEGGRGIGKWKTGVQDRKVTGEKKNEKRRRNGLEKKRKTTDVGIRGVLLQVKTSEKNGASGIKGFKCGLESKKQRIKR